jgi:hypothetical protein
MTRTFGLFLALAVGLAACWPFGEQATADLPGDVRISMVVRPMSGWHSDWYRTLTIETPDGSSSQRLFEDTGWWRGSNLYVHASGAYVLHEGQAGCIVLTPGADAEPDINCDAAIPAAELIDADGATSGFPPSRFYRDLMYVGHFVETPDAEDAISFIPSDRQPEPQLPDVL